MESVRLRRPVIAALAACLCTCGFAGAAGARTRWVPPAHLTWYWQLEGRVRAQPVQASDIDGFDNTAAEVARLHARGQHVISYIDVGTWERWRADASRFPASVRGKGNGFCVNDRRLGISGALYGLQLDGTPFEPCAVNPDSLRL